LNLRRHLLAGQVVPAHPLALTARRSLDERRQRALTRYYVDAGAGGIAVGVHTTQFAIRDPAHALLRPVLELAAETARDWLGRSPSRRPFALIAGACGATAHAVAEAETAAALGYDAVLLSLGGLADRSDAQLIAHCRHVADVLPLVGFYLQPAVGGRTLGWPFWRELAELPALAAVKIAPFNRYATIDVVRAVTEAGRDDVALYTGNDDAIVADLLTDVPCVVGGRRVTRSIVGGLLGQWAVWTREAVNLLDRVKAARRDPAQVRPLLSLGAALTDANAAIFDASHAFRGCIPGIHEVLRRSGLLKGTWCLDAGERLSAGQLAEIDRVMRSYPELTDDAFVREHAERWLDTGA
jgi:dihydrodipicolinate synthase/N-acetylneuraminate lyase